MCSPWDLIIVGKGKLSAICNNVEGVEVKEFIQPQDLPGVLSEQAASYLPSFFEPWELLFMKRLQWG